LRPPSHLPTGAPRVRVSFLLYSSLKERRSVALTINDQGLTTLHEGDFVEGLEIVHILPDRVEVRFQGELFTLEVRS
jgi:Type II secretion system protein B